MLQSINHKKNKFYVYNALDIEYNYEPYGYELLKKTREIMDGYVSMCKEHDIPVLYAQTDSLLIPLSGLKYFEKYIGEELGQLKISFIAHEYVNVFNKNSYEYDGKRTGIRKPRILKLQ
jgi:hypothetical protein